MRKTVFLYGVPGAGKTYLGEKLKKRYNFDLVDADTIQERARNGKDKQKEPFLFHDITEAYKEFGDPTKENVIKGLKAVREVMHPYIIGHLQSQTIDMIVEGSFVTPSLCRAYGPLYLVINQNPKIYEMRFFEHREKTPEMLTAFQNARIMQNYLMEEAYGLSIQIITSDDNIVL
jgi:2-phosphoglycerate kinase